MYAVHEKAGSSLFVSVSDWNLLETANFAFNLIENKLDSFSFLFWIEMAAFHIVVDQ